MHKELVTSAMAYLNEITPSFIKISLIRVEEVVDDHVVLSYQCEGSSLENERSWKLFEFNGEGNVISMKTDKP